jgi:FG-GAP-like repeat
LLVVDRWTGSVSIRYDEGSGDRVQWGFSIPLGPEYRCDQRWGVGVFDMAQHFADIDGDGRADYLCMAKDGRTFGILNGHNGPRDLGQVKFSENKDRANHRFADVNGDGKADFLWIDKFSGEVHVWYNQGLRDSRPADGSMVQWDPKGVLYSGVDRGPNEYFLDYDGDKRADILRVNPITNSAEIWYNSCPRGTGGDDPDSNPDLPQYPPDPPPLTCPAESQPCRLYPLLCPGDLEDRYDAPVGDGEPRSRTKRRRHVDLQRRVDKAPKYWTLLGGALAILRYVPYPSGAANYLSRWQPFGRPALLRYILYNWGSCDVETDPTIELVDVGLDQNGNPVVPPTGGNSVVLHSDHVWDVSNSVLPCYDDRANIFLTERAASTLH